MFLACRGLQTKLKTEVSQQHAFDRTGIAQKSYSTQWSSLQDAAIPITAIHYSASSLTRRSVYRASGCSGPGDHRVMSAVSAGPVFILFIILFP